MERFLGFAAVDLAHLITPTREKSPQSLPLRPNQAHTRSSRRTCAHVGAPPHQLSRKLLRILDRLGCFSFLSAFASIWRMRSREVCGHRVAARGMRAAADDTGGRVLQRLAEVLTTQVDSPAKCQDKRGWGLARISSPRLPQRNARRGLWSRHQRVMAPSAVANPSLSSAARTTLRHSKSTAARRRANG